MFVQVPRAKTTSEPPAPARRVPVQARSRKRYEAILDVAARTFADVGFEAATMEAIAEGAGTSIGSVYQFFPNKLALFDAVAERCLVRSKDFVDGLLDGITDDTPWEDIVDAGVAGFASLHATDPAFRATVVNFSLYGVYEARDSALNRYFVRKLVALLAPRAPTQSEKTLGLAAHVVVQIVSAMLFVAERSPPALGAATLAETKLVVRRYLAAYLEPSRVGPAPRGRRTKRRR